MKAIALRLVVAFDTKCWQASPTEAEADAAAEKGAALLKPFVGRLWSIAGVSDDCRVAEQLQKQEQMAVARGQVRARHQTGTKPIVSQ